MSYSIGGVLGVFLATFSLSIPAYPAHANEAGFPSTNLDDSNYLGAWWLGYIIMGGSLLAISPFFFMLPKTLRKTSDRLQQEAEEAKTTPKEERKDEVADEAPEGFVPNVVHFLKSLMKAVGRSLRNVTIVFLILSGAAQLATFSGLQLFGAKYLEVQFYLDPVFSSILFGIVVIPSGIFGNLIGGCLVKVFGKTTLRIGYLLLFFTAITIIIDPIFLFVGCPNRQLVGVNQQYPLLDAENTTSLEATCNVNNNCTCDVDFEPICGHDNLTYFSPCFAGCESSSVDEMNITV
ncbi:putative solute carrier organic anion transporter family member 2A1 [Apostichopus japonicus]|uniref:Putative solute carrier organic anion transporter family member 2A1 n=1 Tax=Stichopus japonicus TaxID=307972 RepID=A0A2G8JCA6_STIJA|nr:putative solute carrier organic anion transporter family member 2A1 [Apostichopus japonicus]